MECTVTSICVLRTWSPIFGSRLNSFNLFKVRLCFCKIPEYINFYSYRIKNNRRDFALSFCVLFLSNLTVVSWRPAFYWRRNRVGVDLGERTCGGKLAGVDGGETCGQNVLPCMRKERNPLKNWMIPTLTKCLSDIYYYTNLHGLSFSLHCLVI